MATFLYKLGRFAFRRRHFVALIWVALLTLAGVGAAQAPAAGSTSFSIPGTEAQKAFDLLEDRFPGASADGATARVVFKAPDGEKITSSANKAVVKETVKELGTGSEVASVADPFQVKAVSQDRTIAYAQVSYKVSGMELEDSSREALEDTAQEARDAGLTVEIGGDALQAVPHTGATEVIGIGVAAVVLVITFGSLIAAGLPLLTALIGVGIGISTITALASTLDLGSTTSTLAMMIGLAVGIDYALFIVSRYRAELAEGREREEAAGRAVGTAGSAVVFAGLTVVIALVGLAVVNIPMLTKMGIAAAGTVVIAVLIALTLVPALLGYAGRKVRPAGAKGKLRGGRKKAEGASGHTADNPSGHSAEKPNMGTRWARFVVRRPVAVLLLGVVGLGAAAVPATSLELGLPDDGSQPTSTTQRKAYDLLSEGFGPGFNGPLMVVVDAKSSDAPKTAVKEVTTTIRGLGDVAAVTPATYNEAGDTAMITVVPDSKPSSAETEDLVHAIRDAGGDIKADTGAKVLVTGSTAMNIDVSQKLNDALLPYLALVVGLAFLLLIVVFRSILVPLKAALGFLLSVLAALGAVVAVFQWGWLADLMGVEETGPVMSMMPIFMVGVVFGLAMDYEVFLVTRMREAYVHGERPGQAIVTGFRHGARVVSAAAVIMMAVFAGFIGSSESMVKMIGFGLAIAVFFDAFIVRMAIVPAVLALLGKAAWWLPKWLDRALPNVDVEGEGLRDTVKDAADVEPAGSSPLPSGEPVPVAVREPVAVGVAASGADARLATVQEPLVLPYGSYELDGSGVRGTVRNADGVGVAHAAVTLISPSGQQLGRSVPHADGSYVLDAPGPGSYVLIVGAEGYQPHATTVVVGEAALVHDILLSGPARASVQGTVREGVGGVPLSDARVTLVDAAGNVVATATTGEDGAYAFTDLEAGDYSVVASGYPPVASPLQVDGAGVEGFDIELRHSDE
ncbi:MMPL family transporter [Streptomyces sp. PSKA28]|uniref:MMPL family transporter n=1 Tax=Streptomyces himalayensis subsp. himalayensis TaxID=2756131 RepID=A0A7W0DUW6_9ACTN|nr:MMPL family transporter [Streptomyces himalayensis subsp. himalayensis]